MWGVVRGAPRSCYGLLPLALVWSFPAVAQFPPYGAVADPTNPSLAAGDYPVSGHPGINARRHFYYDCGRKRWVLLRIETPGLIGTTVQVGQPGNTYPPSPSPAGSRPDAGDPNRAFSPATGQNFARQNGNWVDVRTGETIRPPNLCPEPTTPKVEIKASFGLGGSSSSPTYNSTGTQPPFTGDPSNTNGQVCGGATFYPGLAVGSVSVGVDVDLCSGSNTFGGGDTTLVQNPTPWARRR